MKIIKLKLLSVNLFIITYLLFPSNIFAVDTFDFAKSLYEEEDYYRAISEFTRYIFYYKSGKKINDSYIYITKSYYYAEQFNQAINSANLFLPKLKDNYYSSRLRFWLATSYLRIEQFNNAEKEYSYLIKKSENKKISEYSYYRLIWIPLLQNKWQDSIKKLDSFEKAYPNSELKSITKLLRTDIERGINFSPLSPTLAGIMSAIIPGSGQIYTKRIGDGIVAFSLIAALTYGAYYYYKNGPQEMCYTLSLLDLIFYVGNIYTAFGSAHKYNNNFNAHLKQEIFNNYFEDYDF